MASSIAFQSITCSCAYLGWTANHNAFANGDNNLWALDNTPFSVGYFKRQDLPTHFGIAEGWTLADMYAQSVVASTNPNRGVCSPTVTVVGCSDQDVCSVLGQRIH